MAGECAGRDNVLVEGSDNLVVEKGKKKNDESY